VTSSQIANLPLNGRNSLDLALLQPGVIPANTAIGGAGTYNIGGARQDSITYLLDGGINNNLLSNGIVVNPNPDVIEEFRILANNYSAEYGRNAGGIVSVVTKSGTNEFHGSAYDYVRNEALNANSFFNNASGLKKDILKRNQYGGWFGGPAIKEKLFFFSAWQSQRQSSLQVTQRTTIFTPAELNGDFSKSNTSGTGPDANVAAFLQRFPYFQPNAALAAQAIVDPSRINTVSRNYIKAGLIPSSPTGFLISQDSAKDDRDELTNKVDYYITPRDRVSVSAVWNRRNQLNPFSIATVSGFPNQTTTKQYYLAANYVKTISSRLLNDFRFNAQRNNNLQSVPAKKLATPAELGIGITPDEPVGPTILVFQSGMTLGFSNQGPSRLIDNTFTWTDTLSWITNAHTFKTGFTYTPYQDNQVFDFYINGQFNFRNTGVTFSRNDRADFIMGLADEFIQYPAAPSNIRTKNYGAFFQDEWKVRRNLTLSLGLRYEYNTPKLDTQGRTFSYVRGAQSTVFTKAPLGLLFPGDALAPKGSNFPDRNDFAPRFGFAWSPGQSGKTSIRGGAGVFYDILKAEDNFQFNGQKPFFPTADFNFNPLTANPTTELNYLTQPYAAAGVVNPFPTRPTPRDVDWVGAGFLPGFGGGGVYSVDTNLRTPYIYQYNLTIEREVMNNTIAQVSYAGSSSHKLTGLYDQNPFILGTTSRLFNTQPGVASNTYSYLDTFSNTTGANYNSLIAYLRRSATDVPVLGRVSYQFSYNYSKSIDNASGFRARNSRVPYYDRNRLKAVSDFDLPTYLSVSGSWELPFAKTSSSGLARLVKGWTLYPIVSYRSGQTIDVLGGRSRTQTQPGPSGAGDGNIVRANLVAPITHFDPHQVNTLGGRTANFFFDPAAFAQPANDPSLRTYGTFGRNAFRGPTRTIFDLSVVKKTSITETINAELHADFINALNRPLFRDPNTSITAGTFGQVSATGIAGNSMPRIIQLALRVNF
jgi:hypothetical protein